MFGSSVLLGGNILWSCNSKLLLEVDIDLAPAAESSGVSAR